MRGGHYLNSKHCGFPKSWQGLYACEDLERDQVVHVMLVPRVDYQKPVNIEKDSSDFNESRFLFLFSLSLCCCCLCVLSPRRPQFLKLKHLWHYTQQWLWISCRACSYAFCLVGFLLHPTVFLPQRGICSSSFQLPKWQFFLMPFWFCLCVSVTVCLWYLIIWNWHSYENFSAVGFLDIQGQKVLFAGLWISLLLLLYFDQTNFNLITW